MLRIQGPGPEYGNGVLASVLPKEEERKPEPVEVADLLSFDESEVVVAPVQTNNYAVPNAASPPNVPPSHAAPAPTLMDLASNQYSQNNFAAAPTQMHNAYAEAANPQPNIQPAQSQYSNYQVNSNPFDGHPNPNPATVNYNNTYDQGTQSYNQGMPVQPQVPVQQASVPHAQLNAPAPITPNSSSQALVPSNNNPTTHNATGAVNNLVNIDNLFAPSAATIAKQAPKPGSQQQGGQKKPIMNSFTPQQPQQMYQQQQGMHGQQQQMGYQQQPMGYQYQQQQMQYPQQGYAQPGYQQPSY
jgi:hypothetical protein